MNYQSRFWRQGAFSLVMIGCVLFVVLTIVAMLVYPGGTVVDPATSGYSFSTNFFSDLGLTQSRAGVPNTASAILFIAALTMAGGGLILFFLAFPQFFARSRWDNLLIGIGSAFGIIAGLCFIGVALTPANLLLDAHVFFVMGAFRALPVAVICYTIAIFREPGYPNRLGLIFVGFSILLVLYVALLMVGPSAESAQGLVVQAVGQKTIVYASIISVFVQSFAAKGLSASP